MANELYILTHLERLPMYDAKTGEKAFGATLFTAAKDEPSDSEKLFLRPWHWGDIIGFDCAFLDASGTLLRVPPPAGAPTPSPEQPPYFARGTPIAAVPAVSTSDHDRLLGAADNAFAAAPSYKLATGTVSYSSGNTGTAPPKPWSAVLSRLVSAPYPYAPFLKLTHQFRVKLPAGIESQIAHVIAAPVLQKKDSGNADQLFPDQAIAPSRGVSDISPESADHSLQRSWPYDRPDVIAKLVPCFMKPEDQSVKEGFISFTTLWIDSGAAAVYGEDWRASLENKMAQGMDVCQRIIDYLQTATITSPPTLDDINTLTSMALASLRDQISAGTNGGPDGIAFINKLLRAMSTQANPLPDLNTAELGAASLAAQKAFPTVSSWAQWLLGLGVPELARNSLLAMPPKTAAVAASQLQVLHATLVGGDGHILARVFAEQWREMFKQGLTRPAALSDNATLERIAGLAGAFPFRQHLLLEILGQFWKDMIQVFSTATTNDLLLSSYAAMVRGYFLRRYVIDSAPPLGWNPAVAGDTPDHRQVLADSIAAWAKTQVSMPVLGSEQPKDQKAALALATSVPHNPSVQVGRAAALPRDDDREDVFNHIQGIGVFVRPVESTQRRWRCLNMVRVAVPDPSGDGTTQVFLNGGAPVFLPVRLGYVNQLRQMLVAYANQPLAGDSPLTQDGIARSGLQSQTSNLDASAPLLSYHYCPVSLEALVNASVHQSPAQIPGLQFGAAYEFAFFAVSNSGALPAGVGRKLGTNIYSPVEFVDLATAQPVVPARTVSVSYRRRVPVGHMRVFNPGESQTDKPKNLGLPLVPPNVHPRARELQDPAGSPVLSGDLPLLVMPSTNMIQSRPDLISQSAFSFEFGMPSTDRETWQRWVFQSFDDPAKRLPYARNEAAFLSDYFDVAQGTSKPKLQIDDPALLRGGKGYFMARLEKWNGTNFSPIKPDVWLKAEPNGFPTTGLAAYQRPTLRASCVSDTTEDFVAVDETDLPRKGLQRLQMKGVEGSIYRVSIFNCVGKADLERAFEIFKQQGSPNPLTVFPTEGPLKINGNGEYVYLVSPFRMLVEVAQERMLAAAQPDQALYGALRCNFDPATCLVKVDVDSTRIDLTQVYRMEVWRQVWRWQGRPSAPHPLLEPPAPGATITTVAQWEAVEFGEIEENDHILFPMTPTGTPAAKSFTYTEQLGGGTSEGDRRGLHFRFGAIAYSRYEGWLLPEKLAVQATSADPSIWKPVFAPARPRMPLAAPKVRIILPLTGGPEDDFNKTPGLLAILDEPWYELGGIGEKLMVEAQLTPDPTLAPGTSPGQGKFPVFYYETGPDPLLAASGIKALSPQKKDTAGPQLDPTAVEYGASVKFEDNPDQWKKYPAHPIVRGPVGHAVKKGNVSPLFTSSSFIIPAPRILSDSGERSDLRGYFCKLRFKRAIRTGANGSQVESDFSEPFWVQYLPEFSLFDGFGSLSGLKVHMTDGSHAQLVDRDNLPQTIQPFAADANAHFLYLLLTRKVFDVTGRPDQEVFVGVFKQNGDTWTSADPALDHDTLQRVSDSLRARVIEVQVPTASAVSAPPARAADFWKYLFPEIVPPALSGGAPQRDPKDPLNRPEASARIVRLSRAMDSVSAAILCEGAFQ
jgi:hypothetical protein